MISSNIGRIQMNEDFSRIITLLRKERGLSQKQTAADLKISQALLSHYEKGIRECGLEFVLRLSNYYDVSCDYLLGKTLDRKGARITIDDIPDAEMTAKGNVFKGSILPTLNKKLISNSINIVFDILQKSTNKDLTTEVSSYLMISIYKMFRLLYAANNKNPQGLFSIPDHVQQGLTNAAQCIIETHTTCITSGVAVDGLERLDKSRAVSLSPEIISEEYPLFASSLYNLIQRAETKVLTRSTK